MLRPSHKIIPSGKDLFGALAWSVLLLPDLSAEDACIIHHLHPNLLCPSAESMTVTWTRWSWKHLHSVNSLKFWFTQYFTPPWGIFFLFFLLMWLQNLQYQEINWNLFCCSCKKNLFDHLLHLVTCIFTTHRMFFKCILCFILELLWLKFFSLTLKRAANWQLR